MTIVPRRTTTSPTAIRSRATTQAWPLVMVCAAEKLVTCAAPEGCVDHTAKPRRKPMLMIQSAAAPLEALISTCPSACRTRVSRPPARPKTIPVAAKITASGTSLPAVGMSVR